MILFIIALKLLKLCYIKLNVFTLLNNTTEFYIFCIILTTLRIKYMTSDFSFNSNLFGAKWKYSMNP